MGFEQLYGLGKLTINNPGNLERSSGVKWQGEFSCNEPRFACFESMPYGYRAMFILLRNYIEDFQANTITKIINRWAPPSENDTQGYINFVSSKSGVSANQVIDADDIDTLEKIVAAMSWMENGVKSIASDVAIGRQLARSRFGEYAKVATISVLGIGLTALTLWAIFHYQDKP